MSASKFDTAVPPLPLPGLAPSGNAYENLVPLLVAVTVKVQLYALGVIPEITTVEPTG